jgi:hypothetical protein
MKLTTKRLVRLATAAQGKSHGTTTLSMLRDSAAYHEAAHAVVAVRVGFSLTQLHIQQRRIQGQNGASALSNGYTEIDVSSLVGVDDIEVLLRRMLYAAAPVLLELSRGSDVAEACASDVASLHEYLACLDLPEAQAEALFRWATIAAASILMQDDGAALNAVTAALRQRRFLRPSQVVSLIRESDMRSSRRTAAPRGS